MIETATTEEAPRGGKITRRRLLAGLAALGLAGIAAGRGTFGARVSRRTLWFPNLPHGFDGVRIVHLTDLHRGPFVPSSYLETALAKARALPHDMLLLTGDYVSRSAEYMEDVARLLRGWRPPLGAWAVLGNHDHQVGPRPVTEALEGIGIPVLDNGSTRVRRGGDTLWIAGTDDPATNHHDLAKTLSGIPDGAFRLLLSHSPDIAWAFREDGVDLALAGHTHGGQICLPGGQAVVASTSLGTDFARGVFLWRGATLFVNRGLGVVMLPLRTFCPPEIAHLTLRRGTGL